MLTKTQNHTLWQGTTSNPYDYLNCDPERSHILLELIAACNIPKPRILELGCNVGRNLEHLRLAGYSKLTGIDISTIALDIMKQAYPHLHKQATIHNSAIEDIIRSFRDGEFDIVFTMAVLMHIHPDSEWIFGEVARITKHYLITIENEEHASPNGLWRPRQYEAVFGALGMRQVAMQSMGAVCKHKVKMAPYIARTFAKVAP